MATNSPKTAEDQEIDLSAISKGIENGVQNLSSWIYRCIRFFLKNIIIVLVLGAIGIGIGMYLDQGKIYNNQIIVTPNFQSNDYLYSKIELLNANIKDKNTSFLKSIGIKDPEKLGKISIKPINDIYAFVNNNEFRYKTLELMAGDSEMDQILEDKTTSRNYTTHVISFITVGKTNDSETVIPILNYLNKSAYFIKMQKQIIQNVEIKVKQNDIIIAQIDGILNQMANDKPGTSGGNLIYNEHSQLNDLITSKDQLNKEQGNYRMMLINYDRIIKDNTTVLNIRNQESVNGKMKLILPFLFISLFILIYLFSNFYKKQIIKHQRAQTA